MPIVEKNDVDIKKLFKWSKEFELKDRDGNVLATYYQKLIGDDSVNISRVFALRKSAELRKKLRTEGTDERVAFVPEKDSFEKENLIELTLLVSLDDMSKEVLKTIHLPLPKELKSDASLEELEKFQAEVDAFPEKREKAIKDALDEQIAKKRAFLETRGFDQIYKDYISYIINELCEKEMYQSFTEMCTFLGTYIDEECKRRVFDVFAEFDALPPEIKNQFITSYLTLEISAENLKKLPQVTP